MNGHRQEYIYYSQLSADAYRHASTYRERIQAGEEVEANLARFKREMKYARETKALTWLLQLQIERAWQ